jgi:hypothetical protein
MMDSKEVDCEEVKCIEPCSITVGPPFCVFKELICMLSSSDAQNPLLT